MSTSRKDHREARQSCLLVSALTPEHIRTFRFPQTSQGCSDRTSLSAYSDPPVAASLPKVHTGSLPFSQCKLSTQTLTGTLRGNWLETCGY